MPRRRLVLSKPIPLNSQHDLLLTKLFAVGESKRLVQTRPLKPLGLPLLKKRSKTIAWFEQISHKFSIIRKRIIGLESTIPFLHASMTNAIALSKLRKPNQRFAFLKFTYFVPRDNIYVNNKAIS